MHISSHSSFLESKIKEIKRVMLEQWKSKIKISNDEEHSNVVKEYSKYDWKRYSGWRHRDVWLLWHKKRIMMHEFVQTKSKTGNEINNK